MGLAAGCDAADLGGGAGESASGGGVVGDADAGEQDALEGFAEQVGDGSVQEGHAGGADAERVGEQMQAALDQPGGKVDIPVVAVVDQGEVGRGHDDESRFPAEALIHAGPVGLCAQVTGADRRAEVGTVDAWR